MARFDAKHKENMSKAAKLAFANGNRKTWSKGKKMTQDHVFRNMQAHLKYDVSLEWLKKFDDIEKLKYLNKAISRKRDSDGFTTSTYMQYIEKFYGDQKFNFLYRKWIETGDKWIKPSMDHIKSKSLGGGLLVDNLQFISWLENRAKCNISESDWDRMKLNLEYYL